MTSDWFIEAANFASVNTPPHISEWELTGLAPAAAETVRPPYVAESPFSVECKLHSHQEIYSKVVPGVRTATIVLVEAIRFHVWEDAIDANRANVNPTKMRPVFRAGGVTYGSCFDVFDLPRPESFRKLRNSEKAAHIIEEALSAKQSADSSL